MLCVASVDFGFADVADQCGAIEEIARAWLGGMSRGQALLEIAASIRSGGDDSGSVAPDEVPADLSSYMVTMETCALRRVPPHRGAAESQSLDTASWPHPSSETQRPRTAPPLAVCADAD